MFVFDPVVGFVPRELYDTWRTNEAQARQENLEASSKSQPRQLPPIRNFKEAQKGIDDPSAANVPTAAAAPVTRTAGVPTSGTRPTPTAAAAPVTRTAGVPTSDTRPNRA